MWGCGAKGQGGKVWIQHSVRVSSRSTQDLLKLLPNMSAFKALDFYESQKYLRNQIMSCFAFNMIQVKLEQLQEGMTTRGW